MTALMTITENNMSLVAYDRGNDIQVFIKGVKTQERWFSRYIASQNETFEQCAFRVFNHLAEENSTKILPIINKPAP